MKYNYFVNVLKYIFQAHVLYWYFYSEISALSTPDNIQ